MRVSQSLSLVYVCARASLTNIEVSTEDVTHCRERERECQLGRPAYKRGCYLSAQMKLFPSRKFCARLNVSILLPFYFFINVFFIFFFTRLQKLLDTFFDVVEIYRNPNFYLFFCFFTQTFEPEQPSRKNIRSMRLSLILCTSHTLEYWIYCG